MKDISKKVQNLILSTLLLASCSNSEHVLEEVHTSIVFGTPAISRATTVNDIREISSFGVWGTYNNSVFFDGDNVFQDTNSDTGWNYANTRYWMAGNYNFFAVYPLSDGITLNDGKIAINDYDVTAETDELLLAAQTGITYNGGNPGAVAFNFHHALTRIEFVGKTDADDTSATLTGLKVYGMPQTGTCEWAGTVGSNDSPNIIWDTTGSEMTDTHSPLYNKGDFSTDLKSTESNDLTGGILVIPQIVTEKTITIEISYLMNGSSKTKAIYIPATTWERGKSYKYSFTVQYNGYIEFTQPDVTIWGNASAGSTVVE